MGANTVELICSRPVQGVARFRTTNGGAFFSDDEAKLFLYDACVILCADLATDRVWCLQRPDNWYLTKVRIENAALEAELFNYSGGRSEMQPVPLGEIAATFQAGFGPVKDGRFPSAYGD